MYSFYAVEQLIIEYVISMDTTSKTSIKYKLLSIQEEPDVISKVDAISNRQ
jgi:hypothetical protein